MSTNLWLHICVSRGREIKDTGACKYFIPNGDTATVFVDVSIWIKPDDRSSFLSWYMWKYYVQRRGPDGGSSSLWSKTRLLVWLPSPYMYCTPAHIPCLSPVAHSSHVRHGWSADQPWFWSNTVSEHKYCGIDLRLIGRFFFFFLKFAPKYTNCVF